MRENHEHTDSDISKEIHWFMETLEKEFQVTVDSKNVGYEATVLSVDEVDNSYVPTELFTEVPETFLYEIMIVDDNEANEWIGAVAFYPETPEWCLQLILKNGELQVRNLLP